MKRKTSREIKFIIIIVLMVALMLTTVVGLKTYIERSIHNERTTYLTAQTKSTSGLVDKIINQYLEYARIAENTIALELHNGDNLSTFMDSIKDTLNLSNGRLILVDSNCTWYGENGSMGKITAVENFTSDTADELVYMTTGVDSMVESICYRIRLRSPLNLIVKGQSVTITYCDLIYYLNFLASDLADSFPYNCNSFIVDNTGLMIYKNFKMGILVTGSNLFTKFDRVNFLYGDKGKDLLNRIRQGYVTVGEMKIEDNTYFICSSPLSINKWTLCFVVNSEELSAGQYINTVFMYILILGAIFAIATIIAGILLIRSHDDRKLLEKNQKANEYLEKASNAKSEFIANISHDIRTPINGIMGMTAIAMDEDNSSKTKDCLNKIDVSARYLLEIVNNVLDMSALENENSNIKHEVVNLNALLSDCMVIANSKALGRKLNISSNFNDTETQYVLTDELKLKQVFINILSNAIKFTPDYGSIEFNVSSTDDGYFYFDIKDTGIGMDEEFIEHIWDRFTQGDSGARSEYKGSGLGMAICKNIVDAMGGNIHVESKLNQGSRFIVELPLEITNAPEEYQNENFPDSLKDMHILIAEDNEINMEIAIEIVSSKGAIADPAEDGLVAYQKYQAMPEGYYDIVLMDLMMPNMNGIDCAKAIRHMGRSDSLSIPIIAMTASTDEKSINEAKTAGMNSYVPKPVDINAVLKEINKLTGGRK